MKANLNLSSKFSTVWPSPNIKPSGTTKSGLTKLSLLFAFLRHNFGGKPEELQGFLDDSSLAMELTQPDVHEELYAKIVNQIDGSARGELRAYKINNFYEFQEYLIQTYRQKKTFQLCTEISKLLALKVQMNLFRNFLIACLNLYIKLIIVVKISKRWPSKKHVNWCNSNLFSVSKKPVAKI